jgi:hypothetical protein
VKNAVPDLRVAFPVPIDSDRSTWSAFRNQSCPADYFIDAKGRIQYHQFGEGEYEKSGVGDPEPTGDACIELVGIRRIVESGR